MTYKGIWLLATGGLPVKKSVSGPIGIGFLIGQAAKMGIVPLLVITAHISMALAVFNLLPFPVLDGGHAIFLGIEKLRGKPLSIKTQEIITQAALILLIAFALFVSWQDIIKFTPLGGK
jgi:regulator of sigma E protease